MADTTDLPQRAARHYCIVTPAIPVLGATWRGGTNTYLELVGRALLALGWRITLVWFGPEDLDVDRFPSLLPVRVVRVRIPPSPFTSLVPGLAEGLVLAREVARLDREDRFDIIEGMNFEGWHWKLAHDFGDRFWMRLHSSLQQHIETKSQRWTWIRRWSVWLDGFAARRSRHLITHSRFHADAMRAEYRLGDRDVTVLPHATPDPGVVAPRQVARYIGFVGPFEARKGTDVLVDAWVLVAAQRPDLRMVLIGVDPEGEREASLTRLEREHPEAHARLDVTGGVTDVELDGWYGKLDLLLVPSRYESFGLTVIEAFSRGVPVIVSDSGALPEVADGAARITPTGDAAALAAAIIDLAGDWRERKRLSDAGRVRYLESYTLPVFRAGLRRLVLDPSGTGQVMVTDVS